MVFACFDALLAHFDGATAETARYPDAHWRALSLLQALLLLF